MGRSTGSGGGSKVVISTGAGAKVGCELVCSGSSSLKSERIGFVGRGSGGGSKCEISTGAGAGARMIVGPGAGVILEVSSG